MSSGYRGRLVRTSPVARYLRRYFSKYQSIYLPVRRITHPDTVARPDSQLVIEGFPRSGNTWTEALIRAYAKDPVRLAHHSHAPAHVLYALKEKIPVLLLARDRIKLSLPI